MRVFGREGATLQLDADVLQAAASPLDRPAIIRVRYEGKVKVMMRAGVKVRVKVWNRVGSCSLVVWCCYSVQKQSRQGKLSEKLLM